MNWNLLVPLLVTTVIAIIGWWIVHWFSMRRDRINKRRDLRVQYLIDAYRKLEYASNRPISPETAPDFEKAVADIQLFGSPRQVKLAQDFAVGMAESGSYSLDEIMIDLRQDLRKELLLPEVPAKIKYWRLTF
jgi:hypothetical protein